MSQIELPKAYNPADFEDRLYQFWQDNDLFAPRGDGEPFVVAIPPPNVTGVLHMGHGLNNSLQDALIRYWRMKGRPTLWVPGTDHAGIATQQVVENQLRKEGKSRHDLGRSAFVDRTWKVKEEHHRIISQQLRKIGASLDWKRERFTMDEGLNRAVRQVFVTLYERGLIYKGRYLVNWDPEAQTAISDDEVEYKEVQGTLYHIRYPFADGSGFVELATTRPETLLGDVAVAVHPTDQRYSGLIGKLLKLPIADREVPLLADPFVDKDFGTGAVKITPAHDPNDFEMGRRHNLQQINILNPDGTLGPNVPARYFGLTAKVAREKIVAELTELGLFVDAVPHKHQVGHAQRSGSIVEPYLSEQWFVRMKPLAEKAMHALKTDQIRFYPKRYESTYTTWMEGIRDWCISRQLWWGHQIPVWTCDSCGHVHVKMEAPTNCEHCSASKLTQDEDVLDTWFSSWLWPFSTLGWPEKTLDFEKFYPTTAVVTAYDIIFFWVARMVMAGMEFTGKAPFRDIYMTPLVRDAKGRKMSKSLGNGIDPLEVVEEFGADALKFTMVYLSSQGQDINLDKDGFKLGSKFANKVWNASRYLLMNIPEQGVLPPDQLTKNGADLWIESRLNAAIRAVDSAMLAYRYNDMGHTVYEFFWNDFCDWYIESTKLELYSEQPSRRRQAASKLVHLLEESLRLMHPFLSFITEEIYQKLPGHALSLVIAPYPVAHPDRDHPEAEAAFGALQNLVAGIRRVRSEFAIDPARDIEVVVSVEKNFVHASFLRENRDLLAQFSGSERLRFSEGEQKPAGAVTIVNRGSESWVLVRDVVDLPKELIKLAKSIERSKDYISSVERKLSNQAFVNSAPAEVVDGERNKLVEAQGTLTRLEAYQHELSELA